MPATLGHVGCGTNRVSHHGNECRLRQNQRKAEKYGKQAFHRKQPNPRLEGVNMFHAVVKRKCSDRNNSFDFLHGKFLLRLKIERKEIMKARIEMTAAPGVAQAMMSLETYIRKSSGLEPSLVELVKMRSSQINGCAYCLDMHSKDARARGETEQRL
jgi:AhpD family alkylhydroperoxidase